MIKRLREARQSDASGFTLIELLIVIVVLGILAGIVVFGVGTFKKDSETAACKANNRSVEVAAAAYAAKTGAFPPAQTVTTTSEIVVQKYIGEVPAPAVTMDANGKATTAC